MHQQPPLAHAEAAQAAEQMCSRGPGQVTCSETSIGRSANVLPRLMSAHDSTWAAAEKAKQELHCRAAGGAAGCGGAQGDVCETSAEGPHTLVRYCSRTSREVGGPLRPAGSTAGAARQAPWACQTGSIAAPPGVPPHHALVLNRGHHALGPPVQVPGSLQGAAGRAGAEHAARVNPALAGTRGQANGRATTGDRCPECACRRLLSPPPALLLLPPGRRAPRRSQVRLPPALA